ncbi:MAG: glycosyltransferase family 2 protein [Amaricoccus sp.]|uniref:glycosyltransferase family 2 protein n=1 Tax=Amaricoccus sp. TaxID=1872485 RepID=UPI0039E50230
MAQVLSLKSVEAPRAVAPAAATRRFLGDVLVSSGRLAQSQVDAALRAQTQQDSLLGTILVVEGLLTPDALAEALAEQSGLRRIDLVADPVDPIALQGVDPLVCLRLDAIPWRRRNDRLEIAVANPASGPAAVAAFSRDGAPATLVLAGQDAIRAAISRAFGARMRRHAHDLCPRRMSCRTLLHRHRNWRLAAGLVVLAAVAAMVPGLALNVVLAWVLLCGVATQGLRLSALAMRLVRGATPTASAPRFVDSGRMPKVSLLVPLWHEERVAAQLLKHLGKMEYPAPLLDIKLVLEEADLTTRAAIARCTLPPGIEIVTVPDGHLRTKPLAMNYALPFCRGEIVGIYDAEDRPDPAQLRAVVHHLMDAPEDVACVQGYLDFYNDRANWLARCFTIEYAVWFRIFLTGIERLGLPVPLGGTTVFFRRRVLEEIGAWDAHNVTEDADLGMRLARAGYRCEMVATTTLEEANCHGARRWIGQRSRWNKGYALTWASHMRDPLALFHDLGLRKFVGFQVLFLGGLTSSIALPLFWLMALGFVGIGPAWEHIPPLLGWGLIGSGLVGSVAMLGATAFAFHDSGRLRMWPWALTLPLYWPLAAAAVYRALAEVVTKPFHWTKTEHGLEP